MIRMAESLAHSPTLAASPAGERAPLAPGTHAGEYVVERLVGAGAMGEVYAGHHPVLGKKVAIKVLHAELGASAEAVERFLREARAVNAVEHAGVVDVFAHGRTADGRLYLVMSFVAGTTLRAKVTAGALSLADAIALLAPIADALDAAHAAGVIHRDLKPDNIMVSDSGRVFVLDFGIAKLAPTGDAGPGTLTGRGTWLGTPAYMAPEQWSSDGATAASDRYALGVIAYELLAGAHPFTASNVAAMMEQHFRAAVPSLVSHGVPAAVDDVIARATAKDPDARWPTARAFVDALALAAGTGPLIARAAPTKRSRSFVAPILGVTVLALGAGIAIVTRHHDVAPAANTQPPGTIALAITTTPDGALVAQGDRVIGPAPVTLHVAPGARVELGVTKPGYLADHRTVDAGSADSAIAIAVSLATVTRFEGVWRLPDGELRAFERSGDQVNVSRLDEVAGPRHFFRHYAFVDSAAGIAFAADDEVVDPRGPDDPTCHQPVHVVYRYDAQSDALVLDRPTVDVDFVAGHCVARAQRVQSEALVRVDATTSSPDRLPAPAGVPVKISKKTGSVAKHAVKPIAKAVATSLRPITSANAPAKPEPAAKQTENFPSKVNGQLLPPPQQGYPVRQPAPPQQEPQQQAPDQAK
jgi:tRNA A-37 threonylcarbamoyl transferase component Bud32